MENNNIEYLTWTAATKISSFYVVDWMDICLTLEGTRLRTEYMRDNRVCTIYMYI